MPPLNGPRRNRSGFYWFNTKVSSTIVFIFNRHYDRHPRPGSGVLRTSESPPGRNRRLRPAKNSPLPVNSGAFFLLKWIRIGYEGLLELVRLLHKADTDKRYLSIETANRVIMNVAAMISTTASLDDSNASFQSLGDSVDPESQSVIANRFAAVLTDLRASIPLKPPMSRGGKDPGTPGDPPTEDSGLPVPIARRISSINTGRQTTGENEFDNAPQTKPLKPSIGSPLSVGIVAICVAPVSPAGLPSEHNGVTLDAGTLSGENPASLPRIPVRVSTGPDGQGRLSGGDVPKVGSIGGPDSDSEPRGVSLSGEGMADRLKPGSMPDRIENALEPGRAALNFTDTPPNPVLGPSVLSQGGLNWKKVADEKREWPTPAGQDPSSGVGENDPGGIDLHADSIGLYRFKITGSENAMGKGENPAQGSKSSERKEGTDKEAGSMPPAISFKPVSMTQGDPTPIDRGGSADSVRPESGRSLDESGIFHPLAKEMVQAQFNPKEGQAVRLHLDSGSLGPLQIEISMQERSLRADFVTADPSVKTLLEHHQAPLREALVSQGFDLTSVSVSVGDPGQARSGTPEGFPQPRGPISNPIENPTAVLSVKGEPIRDLPRNDAHPGMIDLYV